MAIYLIRHAETPLNASRVLQAPDTPLSERGRDQAGRLARRLAGRGIARILSSDYRRAQITAEALAAASGLAVELEPLLRERSFGSLRGRAYADLGLDPFAPDYTPPGGESWREFHERVDAAWERIAAEAAAGAPLAIVTHGLVCYSLASRRLALPGAQRPVLRSGNTALTVVERIPPWRVWLYNCTAHLGGATPEPTPPRVAD